MTKGKRKFQFFETSKDTSDMMEEQPQQKQRVEDEAAGEGKGGEEWRGRKVVSKGEKKKLKQSKRDDEKESIIKERMKEAEYVVKDGMRCVLPYFYKQTVSVKERWFGRTLQGVFLNEFSVSPNYFDKALKRGDIYVNDFTGEESRNHVLTRNDVIHHTIHRHEPPVVAEPIVIVADTEDILAVSKPSSIPIHPSGSYRHNTVLDILARENGYTSKIYPLHRIDRLTSGLLLIGRGPHVAKKVSANINSDQVEKQYLARVQGEFPSEPIIVEEPIGPWPGRKGLNRVAADGKPCKTTFTRLKIFPDNTSLVLCKLKTGRTHQIRVHLKSLGFPIANDPFYGPDSPPFDFVPKVAQQFDEDAELEKIEKIENQVEHENVFAALSEDAGDPEPESGDRKIRKGKNGNKQNKVSKVNVREGRDKTFDEICDCCTGKRTLTQHVTCIWLHAYRYESCDWKFEAPMPDWAKVDEATKES